MLKSNIEYLKGIIYIAYNKQPGIAMTPGGDFHVKETGMVVVLLRSVNIVLRNFCTLLS